VLRYLWGWIRGYVVITIFGSGKEQFLNLALQQNMDIYDVEWREGEEPFIVAKADYHDLGGLRKIAHKTGCRFKLGRRKGLPFFYRYLKKRKMLAVGLVIFCIGLYVLSGFVWFIKVTPQEHIKYLDENQVIAQAEKYGIKKGVWGRNLNFDAVQKQLMIDIPELSWVSIERRGTLINFNVAERDIWTEEEENATVGAIWANRTALIEEVLIKHGQPMVETGQLVQKGALLVSPLADGRADAIIRGRVWYEGYGECAVSQSMDVASGEEKKHIYLLRPNAEGVEASRLKLWGWYKENGEVKEKVERATVQPRLFADFRLPFSFLVETITPVETVSLENTEAEAKAKALSAARQSLRQQIGENNQLVEETVEYHLKDGVCCMTVKWECREEIGMRNVEADRKLKNSPSPEEQTEEDPAE
jgi:sporulation protein YqfD